MFPLETLTLLFNGLTLVLALGFLIIVLWHDATKEINQIFAIFLILVIVWNVGSFLSQIVLLVDVPPFIKQLAVILNLVGYTGSVVGIYVLTTALIGALTRRFRLLALLSLFVIVSYQTFLIVNNPGIDTAFTQYPIGTLRPITLLFYLAFGGTTFYLAWRFRRKSSSAVLIAGIMLFVLGQSIGFLNPELGIVSIATSVSALGSLIISFSFLRLEIIQPLAERVSQVEAMHRVGLAITSQIATDTVLSEITLQATNWLDADAAGIFLLHEDELELVAVHELPQPLLHYRLPLSDGIAGQVARTHESVLVTNYRRDWKGAPDLPLARDTFGSVLCVPLMYANNVLGVLMVITGRHNKLLSMEDVHLMEMLAAQAAVAISHGQLFDRLRRLTNELEIAHSQLNTVLSSTDNPVLAVNRQFKLIFANLAARQLFQLDDPLPTKTIPKLLPLHALPRNYKQVLRKLREQKGYSYEITLGDTVYLCHVATLGTNRVEGWVAVLNDVTQLKELDRIKSEMVRMTSHDLKNPLQAAMANLELLQEDVESYGNDEMMYSVRSIEKQLERMNRIIRGILDLERVGEGIKSFESCDPRLSIRAVLDELQHFATERNINLDVVIGDDVANFLGDQEQFDRALINIVENAIKFTPDNGQVKVCTQNHEQGVLFKVIDTGIGIPAELQSQIFARFFRGRQQGVEHVSGSGLGLSLVKTIIDNHKGRVWLESEVGKGTTFYVWVPAATSKSNSK